MKTPEQLADAVLWETEYRGPAEVTRGLIIEAIQRDRVQRESGAYCLRCRRDLAKAAEHELCFNRIGPHVCNKERGHDGLHGDGTMSWEIT